MLLLAAEQIHTEGDRDGLAMNECTRSSRPPEGGRGSQSESDSLCVRAISASRGPNDRKGQKGNLPECLAGLGVSVAVSKKGSGIESSKVDARR